MHAHAITVLIMPRPTPHVMRVRVHRRRSRGGGPPRLRRRCALYVARRAVVARAPPLPRAAAAAAIVVVHLVRLGATVHRGEGRCWSVRRRQGGDPNARRRGATHTLLGGPRKFGEPRSEDVAP